MEFKQLTLMQKTDIKPLLRWAGSKKKLLPNLSLYWQNDQRYIEPFAGSARLFFHLKPSEAIISDQNEELITCYKIIREFPEEVHHKLSSFLNTKEDYYIIRALNPNELSEIERVARFIYLNRLCFNGLYRTNLKGEFNVPYGGYKTGSFPSVDDFGKISDALKSATIINGDFETIVKDNVKNGDFVYLDPPYAVANKRIFKQYGPTTFGTLDIERLFGLLEFINEKEATFILSYAYCEEMVPFVERWGGRTVLTQRNIAGFAGNRRKESEYLISNIDQ